MLSMYRLKYCIVTKGGKIYLKETSFEVTVNSEAADSHKKLLLTWKRRSHWGYLIMEG